MLKKTELPLSNQHSLESKYQKFWSPFHSPFENAKRVLSNYCVRDLLQWTPSMFHRVGKNRTKPHVEIVEKILTDLTVHSVPDLIHEINNQIKVYDPDSSLLRRLQFICQKMNIAYSINIKDQGVSLTIGNPAHTARLEVDITNTPKFTKEEQEFSHTTINSTQTNSQSTPHEQYLESYKKYPLLDEFNDPQTIKIEDRDYQHVTLVRDPKALKDGVSYLYVITPGGETWFAPQMNNFRKLTHGGLIRKAMGITDGMPTPPVLAAGVFLKGKAQKKPKQRRKKEDVAFLTLASGHFEPGVTAYHAALEAVIDKLDGYHLHIQIGYSHTHYSNLDFRDCREISSTLIKQNRAFKLELISYIHQSSNNSANAEICNVARKILLEIHVSGKDYNEEESLNFSDHELELLFKDQKLSTLVETYKHICPEAIKSYQPNNLSESQSYSMNC